MIEHRYFNWNEIITFDDRANMVRDVKKEIDAGNILKDQPKFQPNFVPFDQTQLHWNKLYQSFILSVNDFLGKVVPIVGTRSWSFMTTVDNVEDREKLWHHHHHDLEYKTVSGVYYLNMPHEDLECGTEFAPNGPKNKETFMLPPKQGQWIIYNGQEWHRPGIVKTTAPRFIVAADMIYMNDMVL